MSGGAASLLSLAKKALKVVEKKELGKAINTTNNLGGEIGNLFIIRASFQVRVKKSYPKRRKTDVHTPQKQIKKGKVQDEDRPH